MNSLVHMSCAYVILSLHNGVARKKSLVTMNDRSNAANNGKDLSNSDIVANSLPFLPLD